MEFVWKIRMAYFPVKHWDLCISVWNVQTLRLYLLYVRRKVDVFNARLSEADEVLFALCVQQDDGLQIHLQTVKLLRHILSVLEKEKGEKPQQCFETWGLRRLRDGEQMLVLLEQCRFVFSGLLYRRLERCRVSLVFSRRYTLWLGSSANSWPRIDEWGLFRQGEMTTRQGSRTGKWGILGSNSSPAHCDCKYRSGHDPSMK